MSMLQVVSGSDATFAAYLYGHSVLDTSSSGYGYTVAYKGRISLVAARSCIVVSSGASGQGAAVGRVRLFTL